MPISPDAQPSTYRFQGFSNPNYTIVPDEVFDTLLHVLSGAELKVLLYIIRRTFGFKKERDNISLSQICRGIVTREGTVLDRGTGLSQSTAQIAIKGLVEKQIITATKRMSPERGNEPTSYSLHLVAPFTGNRYRGEPKIGEGLHRKSATQETVLQDISLSNSRTEYEKGKGDGALQDDGRQSDRGSATRAEETGVRPAARHQQFYEVEYADEEHGASKRRDTQPRSAITDPVGRGTGFERAGERLRRTRRGQAPREYGEERQRILEHIAGFAEEFNDQAPLRSSASRAYNLFKQSGVSVDAFTNVLYEARAVTKEHSGAAHRKDGKAIPVKNRMSYFFSVLGERLGLRERPQVGAAEQAA